MSCDDFSFPEGIDFFNHSFDNVESRRYKVPPIQERWMQIEYHTSLGLYVSFPYDAFSLMPFDTCFNFSIILN